ncbi:uncharacterized protein METZ01_LOCUS414501, partial [marine metagenome]
AEPSGYKCKSSLEPRYASTASGLVPSGVSLDDNFTKRLSLGALESPGT